MLLHSHSVRAEKPSKFYLDWTFFLQDHTSQSLVLSQTHLHLIFYLSFPSKFILEDLELSGLQTDCFAFLIKSFA